MSTFVLQVNKTTTCGINVGYFSMLLSEKAYNDNVVSHCCQERSYILGELACIYSVGIIEISVLNWEPWGGDFSRGFF